MRDSHSNRQCRISSMGKKTRKRARRQGLGEIATFTDLPFATGTDQPQPRFSEVVESSLQKTGLRPKEEDLPPAAVCRRPVASLDLHGKTALEAEAAVTNFLLTHRKRRSPAVRIVTGKGLHSTGKPVLKEVVETILRLERHEGRIVSFSWEGNNRENAGGVVVVLDISGCQPADPAQYGQNW